ncbi:hypothetical protein OP10G_3884 [Fimbriimonas ginsengisoli Gsoil 348]|uniref:Uncharacterized protein n=1 Tax=Fimbriimonas ginsengisoli Gsoil 348 TaxID=661478 RepID=A0A068NV57_FIMGI|nr:hypothetical protein OP10G_3884 [Fimbriimonas ginsengisoli Gsoil 348]
MVLILLLFYSGIRVVRHEGLPTSCEMLPQTLEWVSVMKGSYLDS